MSRRAAIAAAALALLTACPAPLRGGRPAPAPTSRPPSPPSPIPLQGEAGRDEPAPAGVEHVVKPGETLYRIARTYGIAPADLMETNGIADPRTLAVGTRLRVPGAAAPPARDGAGAAGAPSDAAAAPGPASPWASRPTEPAAVGGIPQDRGEAPSRLGWPLRGVLYGRYGVRAGKPHDGIDIAAPEGTEVVAAADGTVIYVGEQPAFGTVVILRHEGGLVTLYAHNSAVLVQDGARVARGQPIAKVGQTGRTTGPHLHFEVRQGTRPRNPLLFLP